VKSLDIHKGKVLILDFGSQYTQLIARRVRELRVYCEIVPFFIPLEEIEHLHPSGLILSGGPASVYNPKAPSCPKELFALNIPVLGICYGMQLMAHLLGGKVVPSPMREYGRTQLIIADGQDLFQGLGVEALTVWMSHGDTVVELPDHFQTIAHTENCPTAAMRSVDGRLFGLQFHPEVVHTQNGTQIIKNFLFQVCHCSPLWNMQSFIEYSVKKIRSEMGKAQVLCALSGGVDSTVAAALLQRAIGSRSRCIFVDNGLLRAGEAQRVLETFKDNFTGELIFRDTAERFLEKLNGVIDPEEKRKVIGREFISVFEEEADRLGAIEYLVQGTLYPDVIESISYKGPSATIKSHHNVGGLPEAMELKLLEPLRELFKDEVRELGKELGLPARVLERHPFPGPGLAVRITGEITPERLDTLRQADAIFLEELHQSGLYDQVWQAFAILLPIKTVGVMGDERTYENVVALRAVTSLDGMTADWAKLPHTFLEKTSNRIINEIKGVNRVVYDISSKPPSTIEWE